MSEQDLFDHFFCVFILHFFYNFVNDKICHFIDYLFIWVCSLQNIVYINLLKLIYFSLKIIHFLLGLFASHISKIQEHSRTQKELKEILFSDTIIDNTKKKSNKFKINSQDTSDITKNEIDEKKETFDLPQHLFLNQELFFFIPIDRAVHVLMAIFESAKVNIELQKKLFYQLELQTHVLNKSGNYCII